MCVAQNKASILNDFHLACHHVLDGNFRINSRKKRKSANQNQRFAALQGAMDHPSWPLLTIVDLSCFVQHDKSKKKTDS